MGKIHASWLLVRLTVSKWRDDNIDWLAAALAYYALFSLAPTFIIVVTLGGLVFGEEAVTGQIVVHIQELVGYKTALTIQKMIEAGLGLASLTTANLFSFGILLYAATNVFTNLKLTLNKIWQVEQKPRHWVLTFIINRFFSFLMVLSIGLLLLSLVIIDIGLAGFDKILSEYVPAFTHVYIWQIGNLFVSFVIITILFATMFKTLPDAKIAWKDVWLGASISSFLFTLSKFLIGIYLGNSRIITLFGAASSFVVILVWVYFAIRIIFLGAAVSHNYALHFGSLRPGGTDEETEKAAEERFVQMTREELKRHQERLEQANISNPTGRKE